MDEPAKTPGRSQPLIRLPAGCGLVLALAIALPVLFSGYVWHRMRLAEEQAREAQKAHAEEVFAPALAQLEPEPEAPVDLDATIRVVHEIDLALKQQESLDEWLRFAATRDHRGVAPEVLASRKEILGILREMYARQTQASEQQAVWELTSELLLSTLSVVSVSGETGLTGPAGSLSVDREQARGLLADLKQRQEARARLLEELDGLDRDLFDALQRYADIYWDHVEQWDQLSVLRDRAWLAVATGDWEAARASADLAVARAPLEREAHLIAALARIETGRPEELEAAGDLLEDYIARHPDRSAPALLLLGALHDKRGDSRQATLALQQAAAYYPRQAEHLQDMLDPYQMRAFLHRSREGGTILEQYRSMMLGAGYFSPDLQLARVLFEDGDEDTARAKVLDHFARRRAQKQWDFVLSDLRFCHDLLGPHYWEIFPEDRWLDLKVNPPMFGSGLKLAVHNRSGRTLHNATLVLALHMTDMMPGQYAAIAAGATVPAVMPQATTDFGTVEIAVDVDGVTKTADDIVHHRAILVTNEAVVWVDTDAYRIAEAEAFRERRRARSSGAPPPPPPAATRYPGFNRTVDAIVEQVGREADLSVVSRYGPDDVVIRLPRELALLRPTFRLERNGELLVAKDNAIDGDEIVLRFPSVANYDNVADPGALKLVMSSPFGDLELAWTADEGASWRLRGTRRK